MSILDKARKRIANINEKKSEFGSTDFWKPHVIKDVDNDPGDLVRMICPPYLDKPDSEPWVESAQITFMISKEKQYFTHAPSKFGLEDVVAEYRRELYQRGDDQSKKKAKSLAARDVYYALVIDLNEPEKGVQLWSFGNSIMEVLCNKLLNDEYNIFWDFEKGHDIIVKRYGETMTETKYVVDLSPKSRSVMESIKRKMGADAFEDFKLTADDIMEQASKIDLANFVKVDTNESLEELLLGKLPDDYEAVFKKRREERDATQGRPLPLFIERENAVTKEEVEHRREAEKEDLSEDPLFAAPKTEKKNVAVEEQETKFVGKEDSAIDKRFSFESDEEGEMMTIEGKCIDAQTDEEYGLLYRLDCGEFGMYEVPATECKEIVEKKATTKKFKAPAKTAKQTSVLDKMKQIKEEAED